MARVGDVSWQPIYPDQAGPRERGSARSPFEVFASHRRLPVSFAIAVALLGGACSAAGPPTTAPSPVLSAALVAQPTATLAPTPPATPSAPTTVYLCRPELLPNSRPTPAVDRNPRWPPSRLPKSPAGPPADDPAGCRPAGPRRDRPGRTDPRLRHGSGKITAIRLMPPGSTFTAPDGGGFMADTLTWAVSAEGTFVVDCADQCVTQVRRRASRTMASAAALRRGPAFPSTSHLQDVPRRARHARSAVHPSAGSDVGRPDLGGGPRSHPGLRVQRAADAPRAQVGDLRADPGLVSCVDPSKGCHALGADPLGPPLAIWWVRFPSDAGQVWVALDATTGKELERRRPRRNHPMTPTPIQEGPAIPT